MSTFSIFLILIAIVSFLLIVVIMVQNPKGGGLDSSLGGSTVAGGVKNTNDFLDKSTWTLGAVLIILILLSSISFSGGAFGDSLLLDPNAEVPTQPIQMNTEGTSNETPVTTNQEENTTTEKNTQE